MPFERPTYKEIIDRSKTDIESRLDTGTLLRRSLLGYLAEANAGASHGLHGHLEWNFKQLFPDTAEAEILARWASIWGISRKTASYASGAVTFTGADGETIPQGTILTRNDGLKFSTDVSGIIASGSASISVTALSAGELSNTDSGVTMTMESPIGSINAEVIVDSNGISAGSDEENDDLLRKRLLDRIKNPPHGGAVHDYEFWALAVANVTRAFVNPLWDGNGTVAVHIVDDNAVTAPIPDAQTVIDAQTYIDENRPVTADVTVFAPTAKTLNLTLSITPDAAVIRSSVEENIKDLIKRDAVPGGKILISRIREAISQATGEDDNVVSVPSGDFTTASGEIAVFGAITWT